MECKIIPFRKKHKDDVHENINIHASGDNVFCIFKDHRLPKD